MARLRGHTTLDFAQPLHVLRASLTVGGRTLAQGDVLPWRELGLDQRKVHQLWTGRRVGHQAIGSRNGAESTALVLPDRPIPLAVPADLSPATAQRADDPALSRRKK